MPAPPDRAVLGLNSFTGVWAPRALLTPFTDKVLEQLPKSGVKKLLVLSPAFTADCLETLEEIGERLGVSKSWGCRLHAKSLEMIRDLLGQDGVARATGGMTQHLPASRR